jgi:hypothetical protein
MGDYDYNYDNSNSSGGIIGTIISILILAAIWPYLLALIGIFVAYLAVLAILEWIGQNPWLSAASALGLLSIWAIFYFRLIPKAWRWMVMQLTPNPVEVNLAQSPNRNLNRKFIPSTNLYCYWCTKKLGLNAWEKDGKYYCDECKATQLDK